MAQGPNAFIMGQSAPTTVPYATWAGVDAIANGTSLSDGQIGTTVWWLHKNGAWTASVVDTTNATCAKIATGSQKCVLCTYNTATGDSPFPCYVSLEPTYAPLYPINPYIVNGGSSNGGLWSHFKIAIDSNTNTYLGNTGSQMKSSLSRNDNSGNFAQANTNTNPNYGFFMGVTSGNADYLFQDDGSTGAACQSYAGHGLINGVDFKTQERRDPIGNLGAGQVKIDGVNFAQCNTPAAIFGTSLASSGSNAVAFHRGVRYWQACTNGCADTTATIAFRVDAVGPTPGSIGGY